MQMLNQKTNKLKEKDSVCNEIPNKNTTNIPNKSNEPNNRPLDLFFPNDYDPQASSNTMNIPAPNNALNPMIKLH